jgi:hypothetical protein
MARRVFESKGSLRMGSLLVFALLVAFAVLAHGSSRVRDRPARALANPWVAFVPLLG